jgi:Sporulation and spore germination
MGGDMSREMNARAALQSMQRSFAGALVIAVAVLVHAGCSQPVRTAPAAAVPIADEAKIAASVQKTLGGSPPSGYAAIPAGTALLSARIDGNKIVLDFNKALLANGTGARLEDAIRQITNPLGELTPQIKSPDYRILIEGKPLTEFLP